MRDAAVYVSGTVRAPEVLASGSTIYGRIAAGQSLSMDNDKTVTLDGRGAAILLENGARLSPGSATISLNNGARLMSDALALVNAEGTGLSDGITDKTLSLDSSSRVLLRADDISNTAVTTATAKIQGLNEGVGLDTVAGTLKVSKDQLGTVSNNGTWDDGSQDKSIDIKDGTGPLSLVNLTVRNSSDGKATKLTVASGSGVIADDNATVGEGSALTVNGSLAARTLNVSGAVDGSGDVTVFRSADVSDTGSLKNSSLTLGQGSKLTVAEGAAVIAKNSDVAENAAVTIDGSLTASEKLTLAGGSKTAVGSNGAVDAASIDASGSLEVKNGGTLSLNDGTLTLNQGAALTLEKNAVLKSTNKQENKVQIHVTKGASLVTAADVLLKGTELDSNVLKTGAVKADEGSSVTLTDVKLVNPEKAETKKFRDSLGMDDGADLTARVDAEWNKAGSYEVSGSTSLSEHDSVIFESLAVRNQGTNVTADSLKLGKDASVTEGALLVLKKENTLGNIVSDGKGNVSIEGLVTAGNIGSAGQTLNRADVSSAGSLTADSLYANLADIAGKLSVQNAVIDRISSLTGSIAGGNVTVNNSMAMKGGAAIGKNASVTAKDAVVSENASVTVDGSLTADTLTMSGAVAGSGKTVVKDTLSMNSGSAVLGNASVTAKSASADGVRIEGSLAAESLSLAGNSAVSGSVSADELTASGTITGAGTLTAADTMSLGGAFTLDGGTSLTAGTADFGGYSALLMNAAGAATTLLTVAGLSSSGTEGVLNGGLAAGKRSAFYIGDTRGGTDLFNAEAKAVDGSSLKALGFIDKKITLSSGSSLIVDGDLTSAPAVTTASLRTGSAAASSYLLSSASASSSSYADTVTVGKGSKLTVSAAALSDGAAVIFEKGGKVNNAGTIELTKTDIAANQVVKVFGAGSGTVADNTASLSGQYTMLNCAFILDPLGDGSVKARFEGVQDETTDSSLKGAIDSSIKDPVNGWIAAGNTVRDGSFLSDAMSTDDTAKTLNSAARFSVLSGTVQNSLLAERAAYDSVSERLGFGAASIERQGNIGGTSAGVWLQPVYMHYDSDGLAAGLTDDYGLSAGLWGTVLGADVKFGGSYIVGAAFSTGTGTSHSDGSHSYTENDFDYWGGSLYGSMTFGDFVIAADTGMTRLTGDAEQTSPIGKLKGDADADVWTAGVQARYDIKAGNVTVAPHAGVRYTKVRTDASDVRTEKGASIRSERVTVEQETFPVGVKVSSTFRSGDWSLSPAADASLIFTAGDKDVTTHTNLGGPEVSATSDISDTVSWDVKAGLNAQYGDRLGLGVSAGFGGSEHTDSEAKVSLGVRFEF